MDTIFFPPSVPTWVLCHVKANPPTWTWMLRAGPRAGTTLTVLTVPIHCSGDSHKAVRWLVSIFHLFKASLNSRAALLADGRVIPELVCVYQNNMLLHVAAQMRLFNRLHPSDKPATEDAPPPPARAPPVGPMPPSRTATPPQKPHGHCSAKIAALRAEIEVL